ncbi:hypothetical protein RHGRI_022921 [Rhododendron griersonianum]|uniref:RRM domain-containing protein n=1 Tax=Rhododendron griersonianum TaxID=479676 RepID=A0AAV6J6B5_9ERIC|nr:hypothetical protein RHGRI_022921 [Rhododendron griersonianum]
MDREREKVRERERGKSISKHGGGRDVGGWIPVIKNHRAKVGNGDRNQENFTLFVDNIPEEKDHHWLQQTFSNFGVVKDAFIPWKRSKRTGNKFGFVRFGCPISAGMAVSKLNGLWVENKKLFVKEASFGQDEIKKASRVQERNEQEHRREENHRQQNSKGANNQIGESGRLRGSTKALGISYAQVVNDPSGNGWLHRSAVGVLRRVVSMMTLKESFGLEMDKDAQFRALGGRFVLGTFQSQEVRDALIQGPWMERWFEAAKPWSGEPASYERFAWLGCQGMPLNAWDYTSFKRIGELWGHFISVDEETLRDSYFAQGKILIATEEIQKIEQWVHLEVQGVKYDVLVKETSSFVNPDDFPSYKGQVDTNPVARVQTEVGHGGNAKGVEKEDDDVDILASPLANGKGEVGEVAGGSDPARAHGKEKKEGRVGGSKSTNSGVHLMLDKGVVQGISDEFESLVEESVDQQRDLISEVGLLAQPGSPTKAHEGPFVQSN